LTQIRENFLKGSRMPRAVAAMVMLLWSLTASGQERISYFVGGTNETSTGRFYSGNTIYELCQKSPSLAEVYVKGVSDTIVDHQIDMMNSQYKYYSRPSFLRLLSEATEHNDLAGVKVPFYCPPSSATSEQLKDIVCKKLRDEPEKRHHDGATVVESALIASFPCLEAAELHDRQMELLRLAIAEQEQDEEQEMRKTGDQE
jgi:hypothetical protein